MKYIKEKDLDNNLLLNISKDIKNGKNIVFKTDTVYGIGTNAYDANACMKIYDIKQRPEYKPLCLLISDISMLKDIVEFITPVEQKLIDAFWPGPLTIKFKKKENVLPDIVSAGDKYVRVRLLKTEPAYSLIKYAGVPVVAPSANISGNLTGIKIKNIIDELGDKVDYIIDSGDINSDITSTIIEVNMEKVIIIREGKIKKEQIEKIAPLI